MPVSLIVEVSYKKSRKIKYKITLLIVFIVKQTVYNGPWRFPHNTSHRASFFILLIILLRTYPRAKFLERGDIIYGWLV
jgi:hypothetical protein